MELLIDHDIVKAQNASMMIRPFCSGQVRETGDRVSGHKVISYGLSSCGYDIRVGTKFKVFTPMPVISDMIGSVGVSGINNLLGEIIDPKNMDGSKGRFRDDDGAPHTACILPANSFALCESYEDFHMPDNVFAICLGKSTYARCGIIVNVTPLEPGWRGKLTIELSNTTPRPVAIYRQEGIAQLLFFKGARPDVTYGDRKGKYQDQTGLTLPKV